MLRKWSSEFSELTLRLNERSAQAFGLLAAGLKSEDYAPQPWLSWGKRPSWPLVKAGEVGAFWLRLKEAPGRQRIAERSGAPKRDG